MLSRIFIISAAFFFIHSTIAISQKFYSLSAGANICNVGAIGKTRYFQQYGFHAGVGYEKIFSDPLGVRYEIMLNTKKISSLLRENTISRDYKFYNDIDLVTIGIPVLTTLHFKRFSFELGPYFDFLLHAKQVEREWIYQKYGDYVEEEIFYDRQNLKNLEIGFILGMKAPLTKNISLSARYAQGFTPIGREYLWTRFNMFQFSAVFNIGKRFAPSKMKPLPKLSDNQSDNIQYRTVTSNHINRIDYAKVGPGNRIYFRIRSADFSSVIISDFTIEASSGYTIITATEKSINDVIFPFQGTIRYTVTNSVSRSSYESYLQFTINESGVWEIGLVNN